MYHPRYIFFKRYFEEGKKAFDQTSYLYKMYDLEKNFDISSGSLSYMFSITKKHKIERLDVFKNMKERMN